MAEITTLRFQRENKPKIEDVIPHCVAAEHQKNALSFIAWLRANKMSPGWSGVHNAWDAKCKSKTICKISLKNDGWNVNEKLKNHTWEIKLYCHNRDRYEESIVNEGLQDIIWDGLYECDECLGGTKPCIGGNNYTVYGKEFKGICGHSFYTRIFDSGEAAIDGIKKLLEFEKQART